MGILKGFFDDDVSIIVKSNWNVVEMLASLFGIWMVMSIASDSDAIREDVSYVCSSAAYRAQEGWLLLWLQWLVRCKLSQT